MQHQTKEKYRPVVLIILDGFGVNVDAPESTWKYAKMPTLQMLEEQFPFTTLQASGLAVGLPWGEEGNSEVGHLTIGAGRALFHHLPRIISAIQDKSFFENPAFLDAAEHTRRYNSTLHLMGLFSSGSVHAYADHLYALLDFAKAQNIKSVYLHLFTDGKDAPPQEGKIFFQHLEERLSKQYTFVRIGSIMGRLYAMDRDENWDRIKQAYECLTKESHNTFSFASQYIEGAYAKGLNDTSLEPAVIAGQEGRIREGDALIFYDFREDSERELTSAFVASSFSYFPREKIKNLFFVTMTEYDPTFDARVAFPPLDIHWPLARSISEAGLKQLHIAETEKYAHVTYFFNGGRERAFSGEDRILIHSPRAVHFDDVPEMSALQIADAVLENISKYDFILVNFANGDIVGHTGNFKATVKALEVLDAMLSKIISPVLNLGGALIITADHGNAEEKIYTTSGEQRTKHTLNPVPFFVVTSDLKRTNIRSQTEIKHIYKRAEGVITDVAPTVLALMGIRSPAEMSGFNLLPKILEKI